jgi:IS1 family transposase
MEDEPDWSKLRILHAWGSRRQAGVYAEIAAANDLPVQDFIYAKTAYSYETGFEGVCDELLASLGSKEPKPMFDAILIDEAQDLPRSFFELCYRSCRVPNRVVYAYDELQNLGAYSMAPPAELFGAGADGIPRVPNLDSDEDSPRRDIVLPVCYRNTPWALTTAHAIGFGIYRKRGLIQFFENAHLLEEVGYRVRSGSLEPGRSVELERGPNSYPPYFVDLIDPDDAVAWHRFDDAANQAGSVLTSDSGEEGDGGWAAAGLVWALCALVVFLCAVSFPFTQRTGSIASHLTHSSAKPEVGVTGFRGEQMVVIDSPPQMQIKGTQVCSAPPIHKSEINNNRSIGTPVSPDHVSNSKFGHPLLIRWAVRSCGRCPKRALNVDGGSRPDVFDSDLEVPDLLAQSVGRYGARRRCNHEPCSLSLNHSLDLILCRTGGFPSRLRRLCSVACLFCDSYEGQEDRPDGSPVGPPKGVVEYVPTWAVPVGILWVFLGMVFIRYSGKSRFVFVGGFLCVIQGGVLITNGYVERTPENQDEKHQIFQHDSENVSQKHLTDAILSYYSYFSEVDMANVLNTDKQIAVIAALAEGSSIRSIERMTGIHRDTIMRLGVKVGQGCTAMMDAKMRNLPCTRLELDEIWGFVGKKERHIQQGDDPQLGSVWTWCAIDAETKLVPTFRVGDRGRVAAHAFVKDIASRMRNRVQISTDGLGDYISAIENAFGADVDYAQIIKTYGHEETNDNRRYSAPEFVSSEKKIITGRPDVDLISTSYVERLNATTRLHMRRLTRLTLAFSKKRENFAAAVGLHFAYYNFVRRHNTLRCTPAMAAGVAGTQWSVGDLVEATA